MSLLSSSLSVLKSLCSHPYARDDRSAKEWRKLLQSAMITILHYANGRSPTTNSANAATRVTSVTSVGGGDKIEEEQEDDYPGRWRCD